MKIQLKIHSLLLAIPATLIFTQMAVISSSFGFTPVEKYDKKAILADTATLNYLQIPVLTQSEATGVAAALITPEQEVQIVEFSHSQHKCGGFEDLRISSDLVTQPAFVKSKGLEIAQAELKKLEQQNKREISYLKGPYKTFSLVKKDEIEKAVAQISSANIQTWVNWLSTYPNRYNKSKSPNGHVDALELKVKNSLAGVEFPFKVEQIAHKSTAQKSLKLSFTGKTRPQEIVVLGGHLDSISNDWGNKEKAPGADDNASGSASLLEAVRVFVTHGQPERTVEFFWYAGEESGLLGSAEIAQNYKANNKNVVAVLQLDMTLYPGAGFKTIGSITDNTSGWLRDYFNEINKNYLHVNIVDDECGYGCSDHASWYKQGYPTLLPFEATMQTMNDDIHTAKDIVNSSMNFDHSAVFSQTAVIFALELGNSDLKQPY